MTIRYRQTLLKVQAEWPEFKVVFKADSTLMKLFDVGLRIITFNQMNVFMTDFVTTIGETMYVPGSWDDRDDTSKAVTLRHEAIHVRQKDRYGSLLYMLRYTFWPLPILWAKGRRDIEQEAYAETLKAWSDYDAEYVILDATFRAKVINQFMSANYFWTWPWRDSVARWYDDTVREIIRDKADRLKVSSR